MLRRSTADLWKLCLSTFFSGGFFESVSILLSHTGNNWGRIYYLLVFRRTAAYILDIVIIFVILAPASFLIQRALGILPDTGPEISIVIAWNFSLPAWLYFTISDRSARGATLGKRLLSLGVRSRAADAVSFGRGLLRTAVKLIPWETAHISTFALSIDLGQWRPVQYAGIGLANALAFAYFLVAVITNGHRSVHDLVAGTEVRVCSQINTAAGGVG
jgi:uncharacterized RDD family membrane protein YckC